MSTYTVKLEIFEGPLDLLLHLIRKNKYDVFEIPIAEITEQYLSYLDQMLAEVNLDVAGAFLVEATNLLQIKSRCLLRGREEEAPEEDPRAELVARLLEHEVYRKAGRRLWARDILGRESFKRGDGDGVVKVKETKLREKGILEITSTFRTLMRRIPKYTPPVETMERVGVKERIGEIIDAIRGRTRLFWNHLFSGIAKNRREIVVTFLALLELARLRVISLAQEEEGGEITIEARKSAAGARDIVFNTEGIEAL